MISSILDTSLNINIYNKLFIYKNIRNIIFCINNKMSSYSTQYRRDHPEWREAEKIRNN